MRTFSRSSVFAVCLSAMFGFATAAHAGVIFTLGNHPETDEENILFGGVESGSTIHGETNQSHAPVDFSSSHTIYQQGQGQGQAMILATDQHPNRVDITNLVITPSGYTFGDFIMNMLNGAGTATITASTVASGDFSFTMDIGNGENYLTVLATGGDQMTSLTINADGFQQFKQPRISGVTANPKGLPEPLSLGLMLIGLGGIAAVRRRQ